MNYKEFIEWDIVNWQQALKFWEKNSSIPFKNSTSLEIGAMNGGLSLWLASKGSNVLCSDLNGPSSKAKEKHQKFNLANLIKYDDIDILKIPYKNHFDIICFKSVLGGIGRFQQKDKQLLAIQQIHKSLKKGGELFFAENLIASPLHQYMRKKFVPWGKSWQYVSINEMLDFLSIFSEIKYSTTGFLGAFGTNEHFRFLFGRIDQFLTNKIIPKTWQYIIFGVAKK